MCDFGVSGQLEKSLAKTNIGCQSYMAVRLSLSPISKSLPANPIPSLFSPNVSSLKLPTRILHILSLQTSGLSVCPLSSLPRDVTPTHRRRMRMCLRSCRRLCMALRQRCHLGTAIMRMISLPSGTSRTPFSSSLNLTMLIMSGIFSLEKDPNRRPTYAQLLEHPFLVADKGAEVDMVGWVEGALKRKAERGIASLNPIQPPVPLEP